MRRLIEEKESQLQLKEKDVDRRAKLFSLLPEAPAHISRMEDLLASGQEKMTALEDQWEQMKQPLEDEFQELKRQQQTVILKNLSVLKQINENHFKERLSTVEGGSGEDYRRSASGGY
jgi:hypothetical protein